MPDDQFGLNKIPQLAIGVDDLDVCTAFYRDWLGLKFLFEVPTMSFFDCDGLRLMLSTLGHERANSILYFDVADIQEAFETLKGRDVVFDDEPHVIHETDDLTLWMAFFKDPEENMLAIASEVKKG